MNTVSSDQRSVYGVAGIAALALLGSTAAAVAVLIAVRRRYAKAASRAGRANQTSVQPSVSTSMPSQTPRHFSENLLVPSMTHTGPEITAEDDALGRSPEGV
ncbi:MAG: hypothetical protein ACR2JC_01110 [Chloroflexota bacterium]